MEPAVKKWGAAHLSAKNPTTNAITFDNCRDVKTLIIKPGDERANFSMDANIYVKVITGRNVTIPLLMMELAV